VDDQIADTLNGLLTYMRRFMVGCEPGEPMGRVFGSPDLGKHLAAAHLRHPAIDQNRKALGGDQGRESGSVRTVSAAGAPTIFVSV
jgi:hypothetical protein